jgi:drug/metabolite transporter (DMT)-like permease
LVVAYLLWNRSVKAVGGTRTAIYMCITPLFAVAGAWLLLGERPHPLQALGALLIVAGVLLTRAGKTEEKA